MLSFLQRNNADIVENATAKLSAKNVGYYYVPEKDE
jgi:hypothetical protein